jgi:hypothetical protein
MPTALAFVGEFARKCELFHTEGKGEVRISWSIMLAALAFVGEFDHRCRLLLWVDRPTPVSVMLRQKAVIVSVKKIAEHKLLFSGNNFTFFTYQ